MERHPLGKPEEWAIQLGPVLTSEGVHSAQSNWTSPRMWELGQSSCLSRGSRASLIQSPMKLNPTTVRKIAIPGKKAMPQELAK